MHLLFITRRVDRDDWLAGHSYEWIRKLRAQLAPADRLSVLCLARGNTSGLENVDIYSLDRFKRATRWQRLWRFELLARRLAAASDGIFCHQNPEYAIAIWPWALVYRRPIVSWYAHKSVTWKTRLMLLASRAVLTASEESFRLPSPKVKVTGHGIDTDLFRRPQAVAGLVTEGQPFQIVTVGRISPVKNLELLIEAIHLLVHEQGRADMRANIIGAPALAADHAYLRRLQAAVAEYRLEKFVSFLPSVPHHQIPQCYTTADVFVNLSKTGSVDKAVLEAMACECPVVTSNEAFGDLLLSLAEVALTEPDDPRMLVRKILAIARMSISDRRALGANERLLVEQQHSLAKLAGAILGAFPSTRRS